MSLVDYADSSDEDEPQTLAAGGEGNEQVKRTPEERPRFEGPAPAPPTSAPLTHHRISASVRPPSCEKMEIVLNESPVLKLPDASLLLNSPVVPNQLNSLDHSSRVTAAIAESAARKRGLKGSAASYPHSKLPKRALPHPRHVPETINGHLLPPQLSGRSNIVTEDISKLFVRKLSDSPAE